MIAHVDATVYSVLLLNLLLRVQMIANPTKTRNSRLIDSCNQNQSYDMHMHIWGAFFFSIQSFIGIAEFI